MNMVANIDVMQKELTELRGEVERLNEENDALLFAIKEKNERLMALGRKS